ncbi:hypothetical protein Sjap_014197 [Stephania japonica]|uniref:Rad21/Rec8-like protein N-terminal domain-containing protein n=1 Tax=Stephania japonica TaxID=461633 RepID=A0AAP0J060_9MAGN
MFYSHQLLARKAPLGQIWMAATMHAKINRRKLDRLNLIQICEEILNPSVPMALRLSGILMGGVVIVYERKVKLLFEDVTRLLIEINEAWKVKSLGDPTVLPKGKSMQAKYKAVTLPEIDEHTEIGETEQSVRININSNNNNYFFAFHESAYITMRLDNVEEQFVARENPREEGPALQSFHQAESANITLLDPYDGHPADSSMFDRFERFDIEGDEDPYVNYSNQHENPNVPTSFRPSPPPPPPPQEETYQGDEQFQDQNPQNNAHTPDEPRPDVHQEPRPEKRGRKRRTRNVTMDYEQTIIPNHVYQTWLQNPSDIVSRRGRNNKPKERAVKIAHLMEIPPVALSEFLGSGRNQIHYPAPLLELWMKFMRQKATQDSPPRGNSPPLEPSWSSILMNDNYQHEVPVQDSHSGVGSHPRQISTEKLMSNFDNLNLPELNADFMVPPGSPYVAGMNEKSVPSSASGNRYVSPDPLDPEGLMASGRLNPKRRHSSSIRSGGSLPPLAEEPNFKLRRLSENEAVDEPEMLMETGPTQTPYPVKAQPIDKMTEAIRTQLKMHFETPGALKLSP